MKKTLYIGACLALLAGSALADEPLLRSNSVWGLSVQGLNSSGVGLRYKQEATAWLVTASSFGDDDRTTEPQSGGADVTRINHYRNFSLGLAWRKYWSSEPAQFFVQPEVDWHMFRYGNTDSLSTYSNSSKSRGIGATLKIGAELFLSANWSIEGYAGVAYRSDKQSDSSGGAPPSGRSPDDYSKYFNSMGGLATTLYWERTK